MKKILRKTARITGITLLVLLVAAFLIPMLFKKQIIRLVKKEINSSLTARVEFADLDLSLFRHFPKISIGLEQVSVVGTGEFANDTLLAARRFDATVNLLSALSGKDIKVYGIFVDRPRIHALVHNNGKANWDITKPDSLPSGTDSTASAFRMKLEKYQITDGYLLYKDETSDMSAEISGLNHEGKGDLTADVFTLATTTEAESVNFTYESIPYLVNAKTTLKSDLAIDNTQDKYSFRTDDIQVNHLRMNADGFFQFATDSTYSMDIRFKTPSNDFRDILSLIPSVYKQDFDKITTKGLAAIEGFVKGIYGPGRLPAYDVNLKIKDGFFQYPDLPQPVQNIQLALHASNPDGKLDNTVIDLSQAHLETGGEAFDARVFFRNPETVRYLDAAAKGRLDLANVGRFVRLNQGTSLSGLVAADAYAKGSLAAIESQAGNFSAGGFFDLRNLQYASPSLPQPLKNGNIRLQVTNTGGIADNTTISVPAGHIELGPDPVDFTLELSKPMSLVAFKGTAKGHLTLEHLKPFLPLEAGETIRGVAGADVRFAGNKLAIDRGDYDQILVDGSASLNHFSYVSPAYPGGVEISRAELAAAGKTVTLKDLAAQYLGTHFSGNGSLTNLVGFAMKDQPLSGVLNLAADRVNLNDWMGSDTATASGASSDPFLVPAQVNLTVNARADQVRYDKVDYTQVAGTLVIKDETVTLQKVRTNALDGVITFDGAYSTRDNKKEPAIHLSYDVQDVDVQKAFFAFNTVKQLMPVGQFIAGKLQSQLSMNGNLHGDMMPDMSTLTGKGNLLLIEGLLRKFAPLEKLANTLQIDELKSITIKDVRNYIEFANGKVLVKPFSLRVKDIDMQIGGMHGFDQSLDYTIQMKLPRKYLGNEGNALVNNLAARASSNGIPVKLGEVVNLNVKMAGKITDPTIRTELREVAGDAMKEMQQQAVDFAKAKVDTVRQTVRDTLTAIKKQVAADIKEEVKNRLFSSGDSARPHNLDSTKKKTEQTLKNTINSLFNRKKKPAADSAAKQ